MVMFYSASFDCTETDGSYGSITFNTAGKTGVTIAISELANVNYYSQTQSWVNHVLSSQYLGQDWRQTRLLNAQPGSNVGAQLQFLLRAGATVNSWTSPSSIFVAMDITTNPPVYSFAYPTQFSSITFSTSGARNLFGFTGNVSSPTASATGTLCPGWLIVPSTDGASAVVPNYEEQVNGSLGVTSGGTVYGATPIASPIYRDWVQQFETKEKTYREFGSGSFTFQALFERARKAYPFAVVNGFGDSYVEAFFLRDDAFTCRRASPGNDSQFHIPFKCIVAGRSS